MQEQETPEESSTERQLGDDEFYQLLRRDGITIDGVFYATTGSGDDVEYHAYRPAEVNGFDAIRVKSSGSGDQTEIVGNQVANHEAALVEDVDEERIEAVREKYRDGFGIAGPAVVKKPDGGDGEPEPMADEEVIETIIKNFGEHGFFAEDENGDTKVVSLAHPGARLMGYITGSHVKALPNDMTSVDEYRRAVFDALSELPDGGPDGMETPSDVPIATSDMMDVFRESGQKLAGDEDQKERLRELTRMRWEDGEYNHLRVEEDEEDEEGE